jgi:tRNA threonylcarbamoyl adenosine modification protein (Sua5/YciO/YrdC/YwlC family)
MECYFFKDKVYLDVIKKKFDQKRIIIGSTDTILGLMGPLEQWAFDQLHLIKQRDKKPFIVLISSYFEFKKIVNPADYERVFQYVKNVWPGPLTCIVSLNPLYKPWLFEIQKTIAVRMPLHDGLFQVIDACGPLFSTSVNLSGKPFAKTVDEVDPAIAKEISLVVLDLSNDKEPIASTIVDCTGDKPVLVRQGAIPFGEFERK